MFDTLAILKKSSSFMSYAVLVIVALSVTANDSRAMGYASLTCEELWERKQEIYHDNAYCLADKEAIERFGNDGCDFNSLSEVAFSSVDMNKLALIARNEERKKCPKATPLLEEVKTSN